MKRDLDLIRKLLIFFEDKDSAGHVDPPKVEPYDEPKVKYHLYLMFDAGFLRCESIRSSTSDRVIDVIPFDLTWDGHEFLAKVRSEAAWIKVKATVAERGASMAFAVVNEIATALALAAIRRT